MGIKKPFHFCKVVKGFMFIFGMGLSPRSTFFLTTLLVSFNIFY